MANVVKDYGLKALYCYGGLPFPMQTYVALTGAAALGVGDPVLFAGDGNQQGLASIKIASNSSRNIIGVVNGIQATGPDNLKTHGGATGSARIVQVILSLPYVVFQVNASDTTGLNSADIGSNFDLSVTTVDVLTGRSLWRINDSSTATTALIVRLVGFVDRPDNEQGATGTDTKNIACLVTFMESGVGQVAGDGI